MRDQSTVDRVYSNRQAEKLTAVFTAGLKQDSLELTK